jgi:hypothetical protein
MDSMRSLKYILLAGLTLAVVIWFTAGEAEAAQTLSKEIAPDVSAETLEAFVSHADVYLTGSGDKEVLLVADPFCPYSRKTYNLLLRRLEYIRMVRVLLVCRFPETGSDVAAAFVMRMHAAGKGGSALETALKLEIPHEGGRDTARQRVLELLKEVFPHELKEDHFEALRPEIRRVAKNTDLAHGVGYTGTPHIVVGRRVLHGYTRRGIDILLKQDH